MKGLAVALIISVLLGIAGSADASTRCLTHEYHAYRSSMNDVPPEEMYRRHTGDHPMAPPDDPDVGDSWEWYTWVHGGMPYYEIKMCTVRGEGEHVYVVVEDSQWLTNVDQEDVDAIVEAWDNSSLGDHPDWGIYDINTTYFGPAPDALDDDPKIYLLWYDFAINADGFFWWFDQYPDGTQAFASNECEVLYMNSSDYDPGGDYLISVTAHEFEHMIHWLADENESLWVDEGMAELAMWLYGHPEHIYGFPNNPDNNLTDFNNDYVQVYLWTLYYYEQMGGGTLPVRTLMDEPADGVNGYENTLAALGSDRDFRAFFADWTCANFLDDPTLDEGQYGYVGEDLPTFSSVLRNSYPVPPNSAYVNGYAADYVRFEDGLPQTLWFNGTDYAYWRPHVLFKNGGVAVEVDEIEIDEAEDGSYYLFDLGEEYDTAVLVIAKFIPNGYTQYEYWTEGIPSDVDDVVGPVSLALHPGAPNPMLDAGTIRLDLGRTQDVTVSVIDPSGRFVRKLAAGEYTPGSHAIEWDGRDEAGNRAAAGVYFVRAAAEDGTVVSRWVRVD